MSEIKHCNHREESVNRLSGLSKSGLRAFDKCKFEKMRQKRGRLSWLEIVTMKILNKLSTNLSLLRNPKDVNQPGTFCSDSLKKGIQIKHR